MLRITKLLQEASWTAFLPILALSIDGSHSRLGAVGDNPYWIWVIGVNGLQDWSPARQRFNAFKAFIQ